MYKKWFAVWLSLCCSQSNTTTPIDIRFYWPRLDWLKMERVTGIEPVYPAWKAGALADVLHPQIRWTNERGVSPPWEDRNFKERGEDFFFISCTYIIQKFFWKINLFPKKPSTIFLICFVSVRIRMTVVLTPSVPTFDETLPILLKRCADCFIVANIPTTSCLFIGLVV